MIPSNPNLDLSAVECDVIRLARRLGTSYIDIADRLLTDLDHPAQLVPYATGRAESVAGERAILPPCDRREDAAWSDTDLLWYLLEYEGMPFTMVADWLDCHVETIQKHDPRRTSATQADEADVNVGDIDTIPTVLRPSADDPVYLARYDETLAGLEGVYMPDPDAEDPYAHWPEEERPAGHSD